jgi:LIM homeobox protein 2/9
MVFEDIFTSPYLPTFYQLLKYFFPYFILKVWFQNARAKWRRMIMKQEGKSIEGDKGESSLDLDSYGPHSPSFMMGGPDSPSMLD